MKKNIVHSKETKQNISAVLIHTNKQKFKCTSHVLGMVPSWCFSSVFEVQKSILFCGQHGLVSWFNDFRLSKVCIIYIDICRYIFTTQPYYSYNDLQAK